MSEIQVAIQHYNRLFSKPSIALGKRYNFDQMTEFCISRGYSALTFFRCGGQMHNILYQISSGFSGPK